MARLFRIPPRALVLTIAAVATGAVCQIGPAVSAAGGPFLSHQALYELNLVKSRGSNAISGARGRILYNFSGSACEGYTSEFRQVSELNSGEGKLTLSDLRSARVLVGVDQSSPDICFPHPNFLDDYSEKILPSKQMAYNHLTVARKPDNSR